jgi:hypothetical protein
MLKHLLLIQLAFVAIHGASLRDSIVFDEPSGQWLRDPRIILDDAAGVPPALRLNPVGYHHYDEMTAYLRAVHAAYPQLTSLYSIGQSVQGKRIDSKYIRLVDSVSSWFLRTGLLTSKRLRIHNWLTWLLFSCRAGAVGFTYFYDAFGKDATETRGEIRRKYPWQRAGRPRTSSTLDSGIYYIYS